MAKFIRGIFVFMVLLVFGGTTALAAGTNEFTIDEIGAKLIVPDNLMAYTRTSGIDANIEKALGMTEGYKEHLIQDMEEKNIYFRAFDANVNYEITLESGSSKTQTFAQKSDEELLKYIDAGLEGTLTGYGIEINEKEIFTENNRKYAVVGYSDTTSSCYLYATVENYQAYYFYIKVMSVTGKITDTHKALIKQIAGAAEFTEKTAEKTTDVLAVDNQVAEQKNIQGGSFIKKIMNVVKIAGIVIVAIILVMIVMKFLSGKKIGKKVNYGTQRNVVDDERLKRIMGDRGTTEKNVSDEETMESHSNDKETVE